MRKTADERANVVDAKLTELAAAQRHLRAAFTNIVDYVDKVGILAMFLYICSR